MSDKQLKYAILVLLILILFRLRGGSPIAGLFGEIAVGA